MRVLLRRWLYRKLSEMYKKFLETEIRKQFAEAKERGIVSVGAYTYGMPRIVCFPGDKNKVTIGSYCSIAEGVTIFVGGNHRTDWITTFPIRLMYGMVEWPEEGVVASKGDVVIGHDVWIGHGATILSGVEIGTGAVIGAQTVVTRAVPPYAIVAGNPGRVVKMRFSDSQIERLLRIKWWEWPPETVTARVGILCSSEIDKFCSLYGRMTGRGGEETDSHGPFAEKKDLF
ncbi:MAG TPA: CatB-related O-acetyltransferase [Bacillota bacterium]|nr:CatB-related O-acetyltransferase [Bacillota bacterium]